MKDRTNRRGLVLGVHPTSRGFGWVLFEAPLSPVDWGSAAARTGRNAKLLKRFERLLQKYDPAVLVIEEFEHKASRRVPRNQQLCRAMLHLAACRGMDRSIYRRETVQAMFGEVGSKTRFEIAEAIALAIDAFQHRMPRLRRPWAAEDSRQSVFDAAALVITYFGAMGET